MKIKFLATGVGPDYYSFDGETITAHKDGVLDQCDLSLLSPGDIFAGVEPDSLSPGGSQVIRAAHRDASGELYVTLCQRVGPGHWSESDWIDAADYDPDAVYVQYDASRSHAGAAWATTEEGKVRP